MFSLNLTNIRNSFFLYCSLVLAVLGFSISHPLYDVYNLDNEPAAIPMHFLKLPMQSNNNEIDENEEIGQVFKRNRNQLSAVSASSPNSCCPTTVDIIEPSHGKNRSGDLVELYQSDTVRQRFYENSCTSSTVDQPCRFLDRRHSPHSRCVQQYSYTYAMVKEVGNENSEWKLDYIQIRSGCSCHITNARSS